MFQSNIPIDLSESTPVRVQPASSRSVPPPMRATTNRIVSRVEGAVKGGRSPAKRALYCIRNTNKRNGLGLVPA
jgi:hypothetical protein